MKISKGSVVIKLGKPLYGAECLAAGALALGERARVFVDETKTSFSVEIVPAGRPSAAALRSLGGEFLDEALNHEYRQRVVKANAPFTQAVLAPLFAKGFPAVPADPLEELEPAVKADRLHDVVELLARARAMR
jgi:hypothetical protein